MKILSVEFSGVGSCTGTFSIDFSASPVSVMHVKTGGKKTLACESILHAFGHDISKSRVLDDLTEKPDINVTVRFEHDGHVMTVTRVDRGETGWTVTNGAKVETFTSRDGFAGWLSRMSIDPDDLKHYMISDQTASIDVSSIFSFLQSSSTNRRVVTRYQNALHEVLGKYESSRIDINRKISSPLDMTAAIKKMDEEEGRLVKINGSLKALSDEMEANRERNDQWNERLKNRTGLSNKIEILGIKIASMDDLIATKKSNVDECQQKIDEYSHGYDENIVQCSRKTEVSLDARLKDIENTIAATIKQKGSLEAELKDLEFTLEKMVKKHDECNKTLNLQTARIIAMGMDEQGKEHVLSAIEEKRKAIEGDKIKNEEALDEISIMKKAITIAGKHDLDHCPCCGKNYQSLELLEQRVKSRIDSMSETMLVKESTVKILQSEIRALRKYDDVKRQLDTARETMALIAVDMENIREKVKRTTDEISTANGKLVDLGKEKENVMELLKREERMINVDELQQKIETARDEIARIEEEVVAMKASRDALEAEINALPPERDIWKEIEGSRKEIQAITKKIINAEATKHAIETTIAGLSARIDSFSDLEKKKAFITSAIKQTRKHLEMVAAMEEMEDDKIKKLTRAFGRELGFNTISMNKNTNTVTRRINGVAYRQNPVSMSTGEKVVGIAAMLARNNTWRNGGFALIDANLSSDLVHECAETLVSYGCEQVIFLMTGDKTETIEVSSA